ncbi:MAG: hypothetical protein R6T98_12090, partial [Desulfatiglandales bacterium]
REFVEQGIALGNRPELVGWLEVLALRKMGIRENLRMIPRQMDLARLAEKVCKIHGGSSGEVRSESRRPSVTSENSTLSIRSKYMIRFCKALATMPVVSGQ